MSTEKTLQIKSDGSDHTEQLAGLIGKNLKGGEVIELVSDLGGGKTTFVRGLARAAGYLGTVASPSYVISREYRCDILTIHHYDFYRLTEPGLMRHELADVMADKRSVIVVEWGDTVRNILPANRIVIDIKKSGDDNRLITISYAEPFAYMMEDIC